MEMRADSLLSYKQFRALKKRCTLTGEIDMMTETILGLLGALTGLVLFGGLAFFVLLPYYASMGYFINTPGGKEKSGPHFFTKLEPGQSKAIVRGDKLVRMITNTAGKKYARKGEPDSPGYWELEEGTTENPVKYVWGPIQWWAQQVYDLTGLVFTGIYPFQRVREYTIERTKISRNEEALKKTEGKSNILLAVDTDISDHWRTRIFNFPVHITGAEVKGNIPLDIIAVAELEVVNPYKAAFGSDNWAATMINVLTDAVNLKTKTRTLDQILNSEDEGQAQEIARAATEVKSDAEICGIEVRGFRILEINPVLRPEDQSAIQAGAVAEQRAKATRIDGKARADALREVNEANRAGGEHSVATMEAEAFVRASEAAGKGGGTVILMPGGNKGGGTDAVQTAILAELVRMNSARNGQKGK